MARIDIVPLGHEVISPVSYPLPVIMITVTVEGANVLDTPV